MRRCAKERRFYTMLEAVSGSSTIDLLKSVRSNVWSNAPKRHDYATLCSSNNRLFSLIKNINKRRCIRLVTDHVLLLFGDDAANIVGEKLLNGKGDGVHYVVLKIFLDLLFLKPVVANKFALAIADSDARKAVGLTTLEFLDILFVVVADVLSESRLLVKFRLLPL